MALNFPVLEQSLELQARFLRDNGFPDATAADVQEAHGRWQAGEVLEDALGAACVPAFDDYPAAFGKKTASAE